MEKLMKSFLKSTIVSSIILAALGLLLIFQSEATIYTISYVLGGIIIALGAIAIIKFVSNIKKTEKNYDLDVVYGVICVIMGILVIKNPKFIASIIPVVLGIVIIISSATKIQYTLQMKDKGNDLWKATVIISIISLICGVFLVFNPFSAAVGITRIVGACIFAYAVLDLASTISMQKTIKEIESQTNKNVKEAKVIDEEVKSKQKKKPAAKKSTTKKSATKSKKKPAAKKTTTKKPATKKKTTKKNAK